MKDTEKILGGEWIDIAWLQPPEFGLCIMRSLVRMTWALLDDIDLHLEGR